MLAAVAICFVALQIHLGSTNHALPHIPVAGEATVASVLKDPEAVRRRLTEAMARAFGGGNQRRV